MAQQIAAPPVVTAAKALAATITTVLGVLALFIDSMADGDLSLDEIGKLVGAVVVAVGTVIAVWATRNRPKTG